VGDKGADNSSSSLCPSDELTIAREHMNFIIGLLIQPDFKQLVNWLTLTPETVTMEDAALELPNLRNFVILTALKIQQLIAD